MPQARAGNPSRASSGRGYGAEGGAGLAEGLLQRVDHLRRSPPGERLGVGEGDREQGETADDHHGAAGAEALEAGAEPVDEDQGAEQREGQGEVLRTLHRDPRVVGVGRERRGRRDHHGDEALADDAEVAGRRHRDQHAEHSPGDGGRDGGRGQQDRHCTDRRAARHQSHQGSGQQRPAAGAHTEGECERRGERHRPGQGQPRPQQGRQRDGEPVSEHGGEGCRTDQQPAQRQAASERACQRLRFWLRSRTSGEVAVGPGTRGTLGSATRIGGEGAASAAGSGEGAGAGAAGGSRTTRGRCSADRRRDRGVARRRPGFWSGRGTGPLEKLAASDDRAIRVCPPGTRQDSVREAGCPGPGGAVHSRRLASDGLTRRASSSAASPSVAVTILPSTSSVSASTSPVGATTREWPA